MSQVLYSSKAIAVKIKELFAKPSGRERRVALVAYLGEYADNYLHNPKDLHVVCNPTPGSTSPTSVERLIDLHAKVQFSDRLHMKVYWSSKRGCVITSANASSNAFGTNPLHEAGVYLKPGIVDIDRLLELTKPINVTRKAMDRLQRATRTMTTPGKRRRNKQPSYLDWYHSQRRESWKIDWADARCAGNPARAKRETAIRYRRKEPDDWMSVTRDGIDGDCLLVFAKRKKDNYLYNPEWFNVTFTIPADKHDKEYYERDYPYHAVQVFPGNTYDFPFRPDEAFVKAVNQVICESGIQKNILENGLVVLPKGLLDRIAEYIKSG